MSESSRFDLIGSGSGTATSVATEPAAGPGRAPAPREPAPLPAARGRTKPALWLWVSVGVVGVAAAGVVAYALLTPGSDVSVEFGPVEKVLRGPLVITITEAGEIEAAERRVISNELRWPVVIKELVDEGTRVRGGDVIILFECKELADAIAKQKIDVTSARNSYTQAHENLELKRKELANKVQKAEQAVKDAKEDEKRYLEGEWPVTQDDAESDIKLAQRDLALATDKLEFKRKANSDPELNQPYSENEIKAQELAVARLQLALKKAENNRDMLEKYDHPRRKRELATAVTDAELDRARVTLEQKTQLLVAEAEEETKKATLDMQDEKLKEMLEDEQKLVVKAKKEGLVVYDTGSHRRWGSTDVTVAVGERISSRQQLMIIPDMTTLQVETKVYEAVIDQVREGLPAVIRLGARPDQPLTGTVHRVGVLPSSQHRWMNPNVKVFTVVVRFDEGTDMSGLKPNMTAEVELVLARLKDVLSVPVSAVFTEQDQTYCWRVADGEQQKVKVRVGLMNEARIQILEGLAEGDRVMLAPSPAERPEEEESQGNEEEAPEVKPAPPKAPGAQPPADKTPRRPGPSGDRPAGRGGGADRPRRSRGDRRGART